MHFEIKFIQRRFFIVKDYIVNFHGWLFCEISLVNSVFRELPPTLTPNLPFSGNH